MTHLPCNHFLLLCNILLQIYLFANIQIYFLTFFLCQESEDRLAGTSVQSHQAKIKVAARTRLSSQAQGPLPSVLAVGRNQSLEAVGTFSCQCQIRQFSPRGHPQDFARHLHPIGRQLTAFQFASSRTAGEFAV